MRKQIKIAVTAGPCRGKTTLVENLAWRGYTVIPEAARMIIEEEQRKDSDCLPWRNLYNFQQKVAKTILELESSFDSELVFCDRGLLDGIAYCEDGRIQTPKIISDFSNKRYDLVLSLDALPNYKTDESRKETKQKAFEIHEKTVRLYRNEGYPVYDVPAIRGLTLQEAVAKRADYVVNLLVRMGI